MLLIYQLNSAVQLAKNRIVVDEDDRVCLTGTGYSSGGVGVGFIAWTKRYTQMRGTELHEISGRFFALSHWRAGVVYKSKID